MALEMTYNGHVLSAKQLDLSVPFVTRYAVDQTGKSKEHFMKLWEAECKRQGCPLPTTEDKSHE